MSKKGVKKKTKKGSTKRQQRTWTTAGKAFRYPFATQLPLRIKVSRDLHWVLPYLEKTHQYLPRLQMPIAIRSYKPSKSRRLRTLGSSYYDEGIINLATYEQTFIREGRRKKAIKGLRRMPRYKILETLAHELAHFHVADHNYEHQELTKTIFRTFGLSKNCPTCEGTGEIEMDCNPH